MRMSLGRFLLCTIFGQSVKRRLSIYHVNFNVFHPTKWIKTESNGPIEYMRCYLYVTKQYPNPHFWVKSNWYQSWMIPDTSKKSPLQFESILDAMTWKIHENWCFGIQLYSLAFFEYIFGSDSGATFITVCNQRHHLQRQLHLNYIATPSFP